MKRAKQYKTSRSAVAERQGPWCVIVLAKNGRLELGDNILRTLYPIQSNEV